MSNHNFIVNPIVIGSNTTERVMTYMLLGVYVSNDLKWNHHVEVIVQKGNRRLYSLRVLAFHPLKNRPHLIYNAENIANNGVTSDCPQIWPTGS